MSKVHNWQIGREMNYPYPQAFPRRQFAFVFNINRCIACQSCTMACKSTWTFQQGPGAYVVGQRRDQALRRLPAILGRQNSRSPWRQANPGNQQWSGKPSDDKKNPYGQFDGKTIFEAQNMLTPDSARVLGYLPTDEEWNSPNHFRRQSGREKRACAMRSTKKATALPEHKTWFFYLARICNHCSYPACLAACPRKAIYKRPEDGIVLIDQERMPRLPQMRRSLPVQKDHVSRQHPRSRKNASLAYPRVEGKDPESDGQPMETRCMAACIGQIRMQGLVKMNNDGSWTEDRYNPLYYMVNVAKVALPLYPQFGTEPNGYYIPPRWVPRDYLKQMFGPGVDEAIERYTYPDRELLAVLQLFRRSNRIYLPLRNQRRPESLRSRHSAGEKVTLYNDTVIAYGQDNKEIFRTPRSKSPCTCGRTNMRTPSADPDRCVFSSLPRDAGEDTGGDLNEWNDWKLSNHRGNK